MSSAPIAERGVAILWIDPKAAAAVQARATRRAGRRRNRRPAKVITIGSTRRQQKRMTSGTMSGRAAHLILGGSSRSAAGQCGRSGVLRRRPSRRADHAPAGGNRRGRARRADRRPVRAGGAAEAKLKAGAPPSWNGASGGAGAAVSGGCAQRARNQRQRDALSHDVDRIRRRVHHAGDGLCGEESVGRTAPPAGERRHSPAAGPPAVNPLESFSNWSGYVADVPPVLLVRVTPRLAEGFWTKVARGAASTQGMSLPPIKRFKSGFSRLRAFCGDTEVSPIHPFRLEQRVSETDAIYEGSVRLRSRRARPVVWDRQADVLFGEGAGQRRHEGRRSESSCSRSGTTSRPIALCRPGSEASGRAIVCDCEPRASRSLNRVATAVEHPDL